MKGYYSDEKLINGIKTRDNLVLKHLYSEYHEKVIKYVVRNKGIKQEAEDVLHDSIETVLNHVRRKDFKLQKTFEAYFTTIYQNKWVNRIKTKNKREIINEYPENLTEEALQYGDNKHEQLYEIASDGLQKLDKDGKKLINLFYIKEKTMAEIAYRMNFKDEKSAKTQKYKAIGRLKEIVKSNPLYKRLNHD